MGVICVYALKAQYNVPIRVVRVLDHIIIFLQFTFIITVELRTTGAICKMWFYF